MMTFDARVKELQARHAELEGALQNEAARPAPDPVVVAELKKQKLRIKDEIAKLSHG